ncbi:uncharacterized protein LOC115082462 isoform X2 [Rhinatrema bivittatum]|uniref:uncharacterized protein LOC115082462 isoform X2 n=1 Tax=Rhinatrema bivittatum TaxID=194408 RepID=UPI00112B2F1C|nr:uncharacterized protein LOC115082462 isoform X2 [Rhinatrema bivittatum]
MLHVPRGQRPSLDHLGDLQRVQKLADMKHLMEKCWDQDPSSRPSFKDCVVTTEEIFMAHKHQVKEAVRNVQSALEKMETSSQQSLSRVPPCSALSSGPSSEIGRASRVLGTEMCLKIAQTMPSLLSPCGIVCVYALGLFLHPSLSLSECLSLIPLLGLGHCLSSLCLSLPSAGVSLHAGAAAVRNAFSAPLPPPPPRCLIALPVHSSRWP